MHSLRIRPKALKKAEDSTDSGKVTTKTVVLDEWVIKSSSGYTITPVRFTLNPFKPKSTFGTTSGGSSGPYDLNRHCLIAL